MAAKEYRCKVELTTKPQADGKRLTFYPEDVIEAKFLRGGQVDRLLDMGVIEEIKKMKTKRITRDIVDEETEEVNGS